MLQVEQVSFRYGRRTEPVLQGVDLELQDGEIGILLGRNGSGKTGQNPSENTDGHSFAEINFVDFLHEYLRKKT